MPRLSDDYACSGVLRWTMRAEQELGRTAANQPGGCEGMSRRVRRASGTTVPAASRTRSRRHSNKRTLCSRLVSPCADGWLAGAMCRSERAASGKRKQKGHRGCFGPVRRHWTVAKSSRGWCSRMHSDQINTPLCTFSIVDQKARTAVWSHLVIKLMR